MVLSLFSHGFELMPSSRVFAIVLVAWARAGKDTAGRYLQKKWGFARITFSNLLKAELRSRGQTPSKARMMELGNELRKKFGAGVMAELALDAASRLKVARIVFSGARSPAEITRLRKAYRDTRVLEIRASIENRVKRAARAGWSPADLRARDQNDDRQKGLGRTIRMADAVVENDSGTRRFHAALDQAVGAFLKSRRGNVRARRGA